VRDTPPPVRTLYYDCFAGIAGDMHLGALLDLGVEEGYLRAELVKLGVPGWDLSVLRTGRGGIAATRVEVLTCACDPPRRHLADVLGIIHASTLAPAVKSRAEAVFCRLAEAESRVHQIPVESVHFHEVGAMDAIVDVVGAAIALERLAPERILCSTVELGSGLVRCAHGTLPVPAPATEELLRGLPTRRGGVPYEATTPTGAAILASVVDGFTDAPRLTVSGIGYGAGQRNGPIPHVLRVLLADEPGPDSDAVGEEGAPGSLALLECNIDDMSPELYEHVLGLLFDQGAVDAWLTPVIMKKGRPGTQIGVLCAETLAPALTATLLVETTTLGVRRQAVARTALPRSSREVATEYGPIPVKVALQDGRPLKAKPEYEVCRRIAVERGIPMRLVYEAVARQMDREA
jgi:pyridinium-3,5-bisthiocarboxylic acid mononucleotide nickel chelatase